MAEVRPEGGDSGANALENRVLCLNGACFECVLQRNRSETLEEDLISVSLRCRLAEARLTSSPSNSDLESFQTHIL